MVTIEVRLTDLCRGLLSIEVSTVGELNGVFLYYPMTTNIRRVSALRYRFRATLRTSNVTRLVLTRALFRAEGIRALTGLVRYVVGLNV